MKELKSAKNFAAESPELYKLFKDYSDHYLAVEKGYKGKKFLEMSLDEKEKGIDNAFKEELQRMSKTRIEDYNGDLQHFAVNPVVRSFAGYITDRTIDMVIPEVLNASVGLIAEISYVDWMETASFKLENGALFNVVEAGYDQQSSEAQELTNKTYTVNPSPHMITTRASLVDILTGRVSFAKYAMKAALAMQAKISNDAWDAFATAAAHSTIPASLDVVTYTDDDAIKLANQVSAWNMGMKSVFAGTEAALNHLLPTNANYRYMLDDAMVTLGHIPQFKNHDVMVTPQFADYTSTTYGMKLADDVIYVVSPAADKLVKVVIGGTMSTVNDPYANADLTQEQSIMKSYGVAAVSNAIAGRIKI